MIATLDLIISGLCDRMSQGSGDGGGALVPDIQVLPANRQLQVHPQHASRGGAKWGP